MLLVSVIQAAPAPHVGEKSVTINGTAKNRTYQLQKQNHEDEFNYNPDFSSYENMPGGDVNKGSGSLPGRYSNSTPQPRRGSPEKEPSKKWSFGGLFRRKEKEKQPDKGKNPLQPSASVPITIQFEPNQRTKTHPQSESESESSLEASEVSVPKQNFLRRKLSGRPKKTSNKKVSNKGVEEGHGQMIKVSTINGKQERPPLQSWETTKKPTLLMPPNINNHGINNYSSSGSLSLSVDGSSLSRGSRVAAREATKARAAARRESYFDDSSSSSEDEVGSFQGSHSSLSSRTRRQQQQGRRKTNNGSSVGGGIPTNSSPSLNRGGVNINAGYIPSSPRWEARVIYTKETLTENDDPVILKLPKTENKDGKYIMQQTAISDDQHVITAGFKVPYLTAPNNNSLEPVYANLPLKGLTAESPPPPAPPRRDFHNQTTSSIFRPMSCSYLDSYNNPVNLNQLLAQNNNENGIKTQCFQSGQEPQSILDYAVEPKRLVPSSPVPQKGFPIVVPQSQPSNIPEISIFRESPKLNGHQDYSLSMNPNGESQEGPKGVSKLGFPVRKLHENNDPRLPAAQSPVHVRASAFWRKKEEENGIRSRQPPRTSPSPNFLSQYQKQHLTRIRSADSSPQPLLKMPTGKKTGNQRILNSNESISSLSSFSVEAPIASPNIFSNKYSNTKIQAGPLKPRNLKSPDFKITLPVAQNKKGNMPKSACERLQVRYSSSSPPPLPVKSTTKTPRKNLEEALNELEDMYKSLRLSDEDLLDRAERRDLPTPHQELRDKDPIQVSRMFRFTPLGSLESLATTSGSGGSSENSRFSRPRQRAPPMRRSCRPDLVNDDMAKRKFESKESKMNDPREVVSQGGSYLALSPAFSPPPSPCPPDNYPFSLSIHDPDLTTDDVTVRNYKRANAIRIIETQPPFGIPLGPVTPAPASDYLHSKPIEKYRPLFRHVKNPDIVKDDIAFRNLRKDLNQENNLSKDWTPRLFSPLRRSIESEVFNYNIPSEESKNLASKKLRAIRSLSANISHLIPDTSSAGIHELGKWNSYSELHSRSSRSMTPVNLRASTYLEPSWVEQANLDYEPEFTKKEWGSQNQSPIFSFKPKTKETIITSNNMSNVSNYDQSGKPRRPWTDIILESFEKEKQREIERQMAEATAASYLAGVPLNENEEDDVFVDASEVTPSESPMTARDISTPKSEFFQQDISLTTFNLLNGQKNRRGSWVEPKSLNKLNIEGKDDTKRKSWSEIPKRYQQQPVYSSAPNFLSQAHPGNSHFTPLPPPRRVKQINLEGFSPTTLVSNETSAFNYSSSTIPSEEIQYPIKGEQELNDLIDALVREADNCGPPTTIDSESSAMHSGQLKSSNEIEFLEEDEDGIPVRPSSPADSIKNLINSINQSLPELHTSSGLSNRNTSPTNLPSDELEIVVPNRVESLNSWTESSGNNLLKKLKHNYDNTDDDVDGINASGSTRFSQNGNKTDKSTDDDVRDIPLNSTTFPGEEQSLGKKLQGKRDGPEFENSFSKIKCHPNSAFELPKNRQLDKQNISSSYPGVTKVSMPIWRVPQRTDIINSGLKVLEIGEQVGNKKGNIKDATKISTMEKITHSRLFQPWKTISGENMKSSPFPLEICNKHEPNTNLPRLQSCFEKSSSSSSEDEKNEKNEQVQGTHKRDSFSDAEGMSGLKRLLRKETAQNYSLNVTGQATNKHLQNIGQDKIGDGIKKSPSAGSTSYWSRISSGQPSFIRKFFEKSIPSPKLETTLPTTETAKPIQTNINVDDQDIKSELVEPVLSLNVAQKATMFMKLEHDQRFSKWHNSSKNDKTNVDGRPRSSRFSTQPITTEEVVSACKGLDNLKPNKENLNLIAQTSQSVTIQHGDQSSSVVVDDTLPEGSALLEPSRLSLKDRVNMFNRMSTVPMAIVSSRPPSSSKGLGSNSKLPNCTGCDYTNTDNLISKSLINDIDSSYDNLNGFTNDKINPRRRRGSDSSVMISSSCMLKSEQIQETPISNKIPVSMLRNTRIKSMFVPHSSDPDNLSEDGEISSGGQEVAEIISKSFENSPLFRKKSWRIQQSQPNFAKELWKKFGKSDDNVKQLSASTQYGLTHHEINPITSPMFPKLIKAAAPTATSNLLPILTALSSSDDQLSEANKPINVPPVKPKRSNIRKILNQKSTVTLPMNPVVHQEVNASQTFVKEDGGQCIKSSSVFSSLTQHNVGTVSMTLADSAQHDPSEDLSFSSVKREGDLLIMKKHMPIFRRKSTGKSKNPLKVLAARMDFRNQKYTETLLENGHE